ncbi:MAG: tetratricopeptide repeat protein [Fibrobacterota bacterium]
MRFLPFTLALSFLCLLLPGCSRSTARVEILAPVILPDGSDKEAAYDAFLAGRAAEEAGDLAAASRAYGRAIALDNGARHVRYLCARALAASGRADSSLAVLAPLVLTDTTADYFYLYGTLLFRADRRAEAEKAFAVASRLAPDDPRAREFLAMLDEQKGDFASASARYESLLDRSETYPLARERLIPLYIKLKETGKALAFIREALEDDPGAVNPRLHLLMVAGQMPVDSAVALYRELIAASLPPGRFLRRDLAAFCLKNDRLNDAETLYREIVEGGAVEFNDRKTWGILLSHQDRDSLAAGVLEPLYRERPDADIAFYLANAYLGLKQYSLALQCYTTCLAVDSLNGSAWTNKGLCFLRLELPDSARELFSAMTRHFPKDPEPLYLLGTLHGSRKEYAEARADYEAALALSPKNTDILFSLASTLERLDKFDAAVRRFEELIVLDSTDDRALNYLGYMLADKGVQFDRAEAFIRRALAVEPENGAYLDSYGWVLFRKGNVAEAEGYVAKAIAMHEEDPVLFEHMAEILEAQGRKAPALEYWKKVISADPKNEKAKNAVLRIEKDFPRP